MIARVVVVYVYRWVVDGNWVEIKRKEVGRE